MVAAHLQGNLVYEAAGGVGLIHVGELIGDLFLYRSLGYIDNGLVILSLVSHKSEIFRYKSAEECYCACAVGENMEELNADSVLVIKHAECLRSALGDRNRAAGDVIILMHGEASLC